MKLAKRTAALLALALLLGAAGCGKSSSDAAITSRVKTAISSEPALKGTRVSVSTNEQVVQLSGTVKSRDERALIIAVARKVEGVKALKTDLLVAAEPAAKPQQKQAAKPQKKQVAKAQQKQPAKPQKKTSADARKKRDPQAQQHVEFSGTGR